MKSFQRKLLFVLAVCTVIAITPACSKKVGCPVNEKVHAQTNKKGKVKGKAKSGLLPRKAARRAKKKKKTKS